MQELSTGPRYLMRWDHSRDQRLGRDLLTTTHRLAELPIFSDEGLADILDRYPRGSVRVSTMGENPAHPSQLQEGELGGHGGRELVEMIRRGRLCLRIHDVVQHYEQLGRIVQRLFAELRECQPGLRTSAHEGDLEISSPTALTYFRYDIQPTVFWQVRGSRHVLVYPQREPFIARRRIDPDVACDHAKPCYFEPAFDQHAGQHTQASGDLLALPPYRPYRIVNDGKLCVTLTTRCAARASRQETPFGIALKQMFARVLRRQSTPAVVPPEPTFCVDPHSPLCIGRLGKNVADANSQVPTFPSLNFASQPTAHAVSEN